MNIGIVVYSKTGNTFEVAQKLDQMIESIGNESTIERIISTNDEENDLKKIEINGVSNLLKYDLVVFASPVHAFSLPPIMKKAMESIDQIKVPAICFVTMALPFKWMGGTRTINGMKLYVNSLGGEILDSDIIRWTKDHEDKVDEFILRVKKVIMDNE
jgi:flavodoxin